MYLSEARITDLSLLRDRIWGEVLTPYDSGWDEARKVFNLAVDQQPAAIAFAESAEDVQAAVRFARKHEMRIAPMTTGHNAGPLTPEIANSVIVRTTRMKGVAIDFETKIARVQAGAIWGEVVEKLEGSGLAALHGSSPTVGVVGYSLTGGVGFQARKHGLQVNQITAIELVNEFGELIRASEDVHPDLFWALRGGGGNFGVVTAIEFRLVETEELHAGMLAWPWEHAEAVFTAWMRMLETIPEEFTTTCRLLQVPPFPEIPEPFRGRQLVVFNGAYLGDAESAAGLLAPLRALDPEIDTFTDVDAVMLADLHMDPEDPQPSQTDHMMIRQLLDVETIREFVAAAGAGSGSPVVVAELRHVGGALTRRPDGGGACSTLEGELLYFTVGALPPGIDPAAVGAQIDRVRTIFEPLRATADYSNLVERPAALADFADAETLERMRTVKDEYDVAGIFQGNFAF